MIVVDTREYSKNQKMVDTCLRPYTEVEVRKLEIGDYLIEGARPILVERKSITNLLGDIKTGHIWEQLKSIQAHRIDDTITRHVMLLEGSPSIAVKQRKWNPNSVVAALNSIVFDWKTPSLYAPSYAWTPRNLLNLSDFSGEPGHEPHKVQFAKKPKSLDESKEFVFESLPGVGPVKARLLAKKFGSLRNLFTASLPELMQVLPYKEACLLYLLFNQR
jgi:Fanconi anemia group M protein